MGTNTKRLAQVHATFRHWLGEHYDLDIVNAVLAAAATEKLGGDPLWLLLIGGPGSGKTEAVQTLDGAGGLIISTIASEGALLSASPRKSRSKDATGGLLRKIGERGILVVKDFTSILSASRELRGSVLAAIREIYDGRYVRNVGTDGGHTLTWVGRVVLICACTTAWDAAYGVVATMGDRFVLVRLDSKTPKVRAAASRQTSKNTGSEVAMRQELAAVVGDLLKHVMSNMAIAGLSDTEDDRINKAANIVTMARTAVERSYSGDIIDVHDPEMPTRFTRQLQQVVRGGVAIGMERDAAMALAIRCAKDSIPPLRLSILLDVAANPGTNPGPVRQRLSKPWSTIKREMEALTMIGILRCDEEVEEATEEGGKPKHKWSYDLAVGYDSDTLLAMNKPEPAKEQPPSACLSSLRYRDDFKVVGEHEECAATAPAVNCPLCASKHPLKEILLDPIGDVKHTRIDHDDYIEEWFDPSPRPSTISVIGNCGDDAICLHCRGNGDVKRICDTSSPGSKSETLHAECAEAWFAKYH